MYFSVDSKTAHRIRESGQYIRQGTVSLRYLPGDSYLYSPVVSKKQGGAVLRNRVKRVIREIMRNGAGRYPEGAYLVFYNGYSPLPDRKIISGDIDKVMSSIGAFT
jgi:ribonuclease P protein component